MVANIVNYNLIFVSLLMILFLQLTMAKSLPRISVNDQFNVFANFTLTRQFNRAFTLQARSTFSIISVQKDAVKQNKKKIQG